MQVERWGTDLFGAAGLISKPDTGFLRIKAARCREDVTHGRTRCKSAV